MSALVLFFALIVPALAACGGGGTTTTGGTSATTAAGTGATTAAGTGSEAATADAGAEATAMPEMTAEADAATAEAGAATAEAGAEPTAQVGTGSAVTGEASGATAGASGDVTKIAVEEGAQLRIVVNGNPTEQQIYLDGVDRFRELFPNIDVQVDVNNDQYETNMQAAFAAGTAPDVLLLPPQLLGRFGPEGLLLPLDDAMQQAGVQKSDYVDALINLFTLDNQTLGVPKDFNPLVMFVNTDIAQEAGVDPATIKTWQDLQDAAQKMTSGEGAAKRYGICLNPDIERLGSQMLQGGSAIIQDGKAVFNQESGVAAVNFWKSFQEAGTGELFRNMGKGWCGEAFAGRNAAIAYEGGWIIPYLADPANGATDINYTAIQAPTPEGGEAASWLFTNAFGVNAETQYPNAAAALALYLTSANNQSAQIELGLAQPSLKALADNPYYQENEVAATLVQAGQNGYSSDTVLGGPLVKGDVTGAINRSLEAIFLNQSEVQAGLDAAAQEVDSILASQ
jgi:multiple sugar transport system substrate-binding protein